MSGLGLLPGLILYNNPKAIQSNRTINEAQREAIHT